MAGKKKGGGYRPPADYDPRRAQRGNKGKGRWAQGGPNAAGVKGDTARPARGSKTERTEHAGQDRREQRRAQPSREQQQRPTQSQRAGAAQVFSFDTEGRARQSAPQHAEPRKQPRRQQPDTVLARFDAKLTTAADVRGMSFGDLGLGGNIVRTLAELGADTPFPIQAATIPDAIAGRDVLGRARTGSGKTIAFGAALVERLLKLKAAGAFANDPSPRKKTPRGERTARGPKLAVRRPKALILAPTRELALQIDRTVQPIARSVGFYTAQLVGGMPSEPQVHALERGVDIIIGTPGRVQDLSDRRKLDLREVQVTILDEADHMCDLGFLEQVQGILRQTVRDSQRLLFSATLDSGVSQLIAEFMSNPVAHEGEEAAAGRVAHSAYVLRHEDKEQALIELASQRGHIMVFCRTRAYTESVAELLSEAGIKATALHGDLSQARRELNLARFTDGKARVLVATDVAARGIHIDDIDLVLQADPPIDYKTYLHRAGRTGRAGRDGRVITLIPRSWQTRTRDMFANAEIEPEFFGDFVPGKTRRR